MTKLQKSVPSSPSGYSEKTQPRHASDKSSEMKLETPYYFIDESRLLKNLEKIRRVREESGAKSVLALKCFATWGVFDLMGRYMDGTTSSSLFEAKLGYEKFGKEVHAYSVAFSEQEVEEVKKFATKIIFNSLPQLEMFYPKVKGMNVGLRVNPHISHSDFDLADPARKNSKLGATDINAIRRVVPQIRGVMFHCNCENDNFDKFSAMLDKISDKYADILTQLEWTSLGGGLYFTKDEYPLDKFIAKLKAFAERFGVQVYLEPGETAITRSAYFVTKVLDIMRNEIDIAIVDASIEAHMLDLLIYRTPAKMETDGKPGKHRYMVAGKSCLAGDVFGTFDFPEELKVGSEVRFADAAGYTMVKKNWFNGLKMPSIVVKRLDGKVDVVRSFGYEDFKNNLS